MSMPQQRTYRYYEFVMAAFVTVLICSNLIGPAKIAQIELPVIGTFIIGAGALFFPISYVFGDILTEVYGYARARRVIWAGFAGLGFASVMAAVVVALPPAPFWHPPPPRTRAKHAPPLIRRRTVKVAHPPGSAANELSHPAGAARSTSPTGPPPRRPGRSWRQ